ncbi:hypothetical protein ACTA71_012511 [Dictyostelium dimigraforme]
MVDNYLNSDNSILFFKIFRNKVLRVEIFKHIRKFNQSLKLIKFYSIEKYKEYQDKEYLTNVYYNFQGFENLSNTIEYLKLGDKFWTNNLLRFEILKLKKFLPQSLKHLTLSNSFSRYSRLNARLFLPESVTSLDIGDGFNRYLTSSDIPSTLKSLTIGKSFRCQLDLKECFNLETIEFKENAFFNNQFKNSNQAETKYEINILPPNLKKLKFGNNYTMEINAELNLPKTLTSLSFGARFNRPIDFRSLVNLTSLTFELLYGQELKVGSLPSSLTYLSIDGYEKDFEIGVLPPNLKQLIISTLKTITIQTKQNFQIGSLPSSITIFSFNRFCNTVHPFKAGSLPSSLTELSLNSYEHSLDQFLLPQSLTSLELPKISSTSNKDGLLIKLFSNTPNLKILTWSDFTEIPPNSLPNSLKQLIIRSTYNYPFKCNTLPKSLKILLIWSDSFNQEIKPGDLPQSLIHLSIYSSMDVGFQTQFQLNSLPQSLELLQLSSSPFHHQFIKNVLPKSLKYLALPTGYQHDIDFDDLPNLISLDIGTSSFDFKKLKINSDIDISLIKLFE